MSRRRVGQRLEREAPIARAVDPAGLADCRRSLIAAEGYLSRAVRRDAVAEVFKGIAHGVIVQRVRSQPSKWSAAPGYIILIYLALGRRHAQICHHEGRQASVPEVILAADEQALAAVQVGRQRCFTGCTWSGRATKLGTGEPDHLRVLSQSGSIRLIVAVRSIPHRVGYP